MQSLVLLHSNDIHGHTHGLARMVSLIDHIRQQEADKIVLYVDCGDSEDTSNRLSNLTKGRSMHQLLGLAKPDAAALGNGSILRYGSGVLAQHAQALGCPLLLANILSADGNVFKGLAATSLLRLGQFKLGLIGLSAQIKIYNTLFGFQLPPTHAVVAEHIQALRQQGADAVIILSHLGLDEDRDLAAAFQGQLTAIIGAHTHHVLPHGEQHGDVLIAQAGCNAEYLGRLDLLWDEQKLVVNSAQLLPIHPNLPPAERVIKAEQLIECKVNSYLGEIIGELSAPLAWSETEECGMANLMADMLRYRMQADVGLCAAGQAFNAGLEAGKISRCHLWEVCDSCANPGVVSMSGAQLSILIQRGLDPAYRNRRPHSLRGRSQGILHLSGAEYWAGEIYITGKPLQAERLYRVAASDFELDPRSGYTESAWNLQPCYQVPIILREALEEYLRMNSPIMPHQPRLHLDLSSSLPSAYLWMES